jgi:hypothetical protein
MTCTTSKAFDCRQKHFGAEEAQSDHSPGASDDPLLQESIFPDQILLLNAVNVFPETLRLLKPTFSTDLYSGMSVVTLGM